MKKQQKEILQKLINEAEKEAIEKLLIVKALREENEKTIQSLKNENELLNEAFNNELEGLEVKERIYKRIKSKEIFIELNQKIENVSKKIDFQYSILKVINYYVKCIYLKYAYRLENLLIQFVKNTRDKSDFLNFFDYEYDKELQEYKYNNIVRIYFEDRDFNIIPKSKIINCENFTISTKAFKYESWNNSPLDIVFLNNQEAVENEIQSNNSIINDYENKINLIINNYSVLSNYVSNLLELREKQRKELEEFQKKQLEKIKDFDVKELRAILK